MAFGPAFGRHRKETALLGRILVSYGELELSMALLLGDVINNQQCALRTIFRIVGETARINVADALIRERMIRADLEDEYADTIGAVRYSVKLRNQYAHCHWTDAPRKRGLYFADLQEPAKAHEKFEFWHKHIDSALLWDQLCHMAYASDCLLAINLEYAARNRVGPDQNFAMPPKERQPPLHNPPLKYIPPWLSPDQKRRHKEHFRASKKGGRKR